MEVTQQLVQLTSGLTEQLALGPAAQAPCGQLHWLLLERPEASCSSGPWGQTPQLLLGRSWQLALGTV